MGAVKKDEEKGDSRMKKVVVDLPAPLFRETEWAANELSINRSNLVRSALERFVADLRKRKLEEELAAGYIANASQAREAAEDFAHADADLL